MSPSDRERRKQLSQWAVQSLMPEMEHSDAESFMTPLSGDAGFRNYYRFQAPAGSLLAVDAPPATENSRAFVSIAGLLNAGGIRVPDIKAVDYDQGFLLVEDFGNDLLLSKLNQQTAEGYYPQALDLIHRVQRCEIHSLMPFSRELIETELNIFPEWFIRELLDTRLNAEEQKDLQQMFELLTSSALQQPQAMMHRDFHSRNLMVLPDSDFGVIDFQGALNGPVLYDAASLLKDCYIQWPRAKIEGWLRYFVKHHALLEKVGFETCLKWFDWIGLQRHIKCLGIFARLWFRDGKPQYLKDIPVTFAYVQDVCRRYDELTPFGEWLKSRVEPVLSQRLAETRKTAAEAVAEQ